MSERPPEHYTVLGLDIIKYSEKRLLQQKLAQEKIDRWLNEAIDEKRPSKSAPMPHWIDAGDGGFALFKWADLDILECLKEFYRKLNRENMDVTEDSQKVLVRSALHKDEIVVWNSKIAGQKIHKYTGHAINNCARLMAGMIKEHSAQVVCSRPVLDTILRMDRSVSATRLRDTIDKHGQQHQVWNLRIDPLLGVAPISKELYPDALLRVHPGSER